MKSNEEKNICLKKHIDVFYLEKVGAYGHGVFWIGFDEEEGKRKADAAASLDSDDYHDWILYKYSEQVKFDSLSISELDYVEIYRGVRA